MQLYLIRHARPLDMDGRCYGQLDVEAEDPQPIAERLRALLPDATPVIASPLQRTASLARALHRQPLYDARLMEIAFGEWEGRAWDDIERERIDAWAADPLHFVPPGGESAAMLQARAVACVGDCLENSRAPDLALVTHAGAIRAILGHWLRLPIDEWCRLPLAFGSLTRLEIDSFAADAPGVLHSLGR